MIQNEKPVNNPLSEYLPEQSEPRGIARWMFTCVACGEFIKVGDEIKKADAGSWAYEGNWVHNVCPDPLKAVQPDEGSTMKSRIENIKPGDVVTIWCGPEGAVTLRIKTLTRGFVILGL